MLLTTLQFSVLMQPSFMNHIFPCSNDVVLVIVHKDIGSLIVLSSCLEDQTHHTYIPLYTITQKNVSVQQHPSVSHPSEQGSVPLIFILFPSIYTTLFTQMSNTCCVKCLSTPDFSNGIVGYIIMCFPQPVSSYTCLNYSVTVSPPGIQTGELF